MKRNFAGFLSVLIILVLVVTVNVFPQSISNEPRLEADPLAGYFAQNFDPGDWRLLFQLAYWASGETDWTADTDKFSRTLNSFINDIQSMDEKEKAEYLLEFIHDEFLTVYRLKQSSLPVLFDTGSFNCLSSAILYAILGTAAGLDITGVNTVDHAFCTVSIEGEQIDVETTNPYGVDPGKKVEFKDDFGKVTGFSYVPPGNYRDRTNISLRRLFALILQNRIADLEDAGRFSEAVGPAVDRWVLLGGGEGVEFEDVITRLLNYATQLSRAGDEAAALEWAQKAVAAYGAHPKWDDFIDGVVNNLLVKLVRQGLYDDARREYDSLKVRLSADASARLNYMISDSELVAALNDYKKGSSLAEFNAVLENIKNEGVLPTERIHEIELNRHIFSISKIAESEGWAAAYEATENSIRELGSDPQLLNARRIYLSNQKAELYNAAARAFNNMDYEEALELTRNALIVFPEEPVFQNLMNSLRQVMSD